MKDNGQSYYFSSDGSTLVTYFSCKLRFALSKRISSTLIDASQSCHSRIDAAQAAVLTLYPNPATTTITLNGDIVSQARDIEVLSMLGQTLLRQPATQSTINLQSLSAGVYLLRLTDGNGTILANQRFVVK